MSGFDPVCLQLPKTAKDLRNTHKRSFAADVSSANSSKGLLPSVLLERRIPSGQVLKKPYA
eukprot:m.231697 g.231697  ORF g.231697 m.231697 type:complete len:61 (+) comp40074_c0_seq1:341-523(+)